MTFPDRFLWGASTAGHQVEGGNVNADLWPLEWAQGSLFTEPSGDACDHYHRYPEDIGIMADLGFNAYRFSLEWARIEPEEGYFSRAALDHYRRMAAACWERDITPIVTYCHVTTPRWFAGAGGWVADQAAARFARYVERASRHLGDLLPWVATLNEPNAITMLELTGVIPMGVSDGNLLAPQSSDAGAVVGVGGHDASRYRMGLIGSNVEVMSEIHRAAKDAIKSGPGESKVGWTLALVDLQSAEGGEDRLERARQGAQLDWLDVSRDDDWVGVQTYSRNILGENGPVPLPEEAPRMQTGWEVYPASLEHTVRLAAGHAQVPVMVTENGMATGDDDARIAYTQAALGGLARCVEDGIDVRGYLHWTLLDNFEWMAGFAKTFGLIAFDPTTFERQVKDSARWLGEVARTNGAALSLSQEH
ncbi:MAG: glycoside hydrolase family 1 protein [Actinomycetes bacterium]